MRTKVPHSWTVCRLPFNKTHIFPPLLEKGRFSFGHGRVSEWWKVSDVAFDTVLDFCWSVLLVPFLSQTNLAREWKSTSAIDGSLDHSIRILPWPRLQACMRYEYDAEELLGAQAHTMVTYIYIYVTVCHYIFREFLYMVQCWVVPAPPPPPPMVPPPPLWCGWGWWCWWWKY